MMLRCDDQSSAQLAAMRPAHPHVISINEVEEDGAGLAVRRRQTAPTLELTQ